MHIRIYGTALMQRCTHMTLFLDSTGLLKQSTSATPENITRIQVILNCDHYVSINC